jgi:hypothetical protein
VVVFSWNTKNEKWLEKEVIGKEKNDLDTFL